MAALLLVFERRTSVQPPGALTTGAAPRTAMVASIRSPVAVSGGMVSVIDSRPLPRDCVVVWRCTMPVPTRSVVAAARPEAACTASTCVRPAAMPVARPPALIVAAAVFDDVQPTSPVRSWVVLSLKVPSAVNCCVKPVAIDTFAGVTVSATSTAAVICSVVEPAIELAGSMATMVVVPVPALLARPRLPAALLIAATAGVDELQVTRSVRSCVELSLNTPAATNCRE